ncbi:hypothetical protein MMC22_002902 [Lobaria immixta]|nr:hypothetical protein [Lobaria immixta]
MSSYHGLGWEDKLMGPQPIWTADPSVEIIAEIAHRHLMLSLDDIAHTTVKLQVQGAFIKLYAIECPRASYFMRISSPVHLCFKILSEVATIALLRSHTSVPVPHILASGSTSDNELKIEWILMDRIPGIRLGDIWPSLTWDAQVSCVKEVANSECTGQQVAAKSNLVVLDRIVSMGFYCIKHIKSDVHRSSFASSQDWSNARSQLMEEDGTRILKSQDADEGDIVDRKEKQQQVKRLRKQLPSFFLSNPDNREHFALHHHDIHEHNLILNSKGKLQGLVDWECVSVMPLWKPCQIPKFLDRAEWTEKLNPKSYCTDPNDSDYEFYEEALNEFEFDAGRSTSHGGMARCLKSTLRLNSGSRYVAPVPPPRRLFFGFGQPDLTPNPELSDTLLSCLG